MKYSCRVLFISGALGVAGAVHAQGGSPSADAIKRAADEFSSGKQAYRDEDYIEAAEHFEAADDNAPSVNALRAAMTSRKNAGQLDRAASLASLALARHPEDEKLGEEAAAILEAASTTLHRVQVICDVPCSLVVGTSLVHGEAASAQVIYLMPGQHEIRASWSDEYGIETQTVVAIAEGEDELEFARPEATVADDPAPPRPGTDEFGIEIEDEEPDDDAASLEGERHGLPPGVFITGLVATAALGGVTTWSGLDTVNNPGTKQVQELCQDNPNYPDPTTCPAYKNGQEKELRTNILIGATAAVGVTTIILAAVTDWGGKGTTDSARAGRARGQRRLQPWIAIDDGAMVGARGRF